MDPNNNQPINTNPLGQPVAPQPLVVAPTPIVEPTQTVPPVAPAAPVMPPPQMPKGGSKKGLVLLIILIILILGMGYYVFFAKNQLSKKTSNTSTAIPTVTAVPTPTTPATIDEIIIASPEADLKLIEQDVQGL